MHFPSFITGSAVTGVGFLLIDKELSYRQRLTYRWALFDSMEAEGRKLWEEAKKSMSGNEPNLKAQKEDAINKWNDGIENIRKYFSN